MPPSTVIPELPYPDVREAVDWLRRAFGFRERLQIGSHRSQLTFGNGSIVVTQGDASNPSFSVMVRVDDVVAHCERARLAGARIVSPPTDHPYGERQYVAQDPAGHRWTFSQTVTDVDPATWGGKLFQE